MEILWHPLEILRTSYGAQWKYNGNLTEIKTTSGKPMEAYRNPMESYRIPKDILWNPMEIPRKAHGNIYNILWKSYGNPIENQGKSVYGNPKRILQNPI